MTEIYYLKILKIRSQKSRCWQSRFLGDSERETFHASLLTSGGSMLIPWFVTTSLSSLSLSLNGILLLVYIFVSLFSLYKDTSH